MLTKPSLDEIIEIATSAWRFAYIWYLRRTIPFPLVSQPEWYKGELAWSDVNELAPGLERNLDRICDIFLHGRQIHELPTTTKPDAQDKELLLVQEKIEPFLKESQVA